MDYERLEAVAERARTGDLSGVGVLSTGERLYVALAINKVELLGGDSIAYAIDRIGPEAVDELIRRHRNENVDHHARNRTLVEMAHYLRLLAKELFKTQPDNAKAIRAMEYLHENALLRTLLDDHHD